MIEEYSNGRIRIDGKDYDEDVKIIDGRVIPGWWRKTGHRIDVEDIEDILAAQPDVLVFGTGYAENVRIAEDVLSRADAEGIRLVAEATPRAVNTFNRLAAEEKSVAGGFHLTC